MNSHLTLVVTNNGADVRLQNRRQLGCAEARAGHPAGKLLIPHAVVAYSRVYQTRESAESAGKYLLGADRLPWRATQWRLPSRRLVRWMNYFFGTTYAREGEYA